MSKVYVKLSKRGAGREHAMKEAIKRKSDLNQIYGAMATDKLITIQEIVDMLKYGEMGYINFTIEFAKAVKTVIDEYEHLIDAGVLVSTEFMSKILFIEDALENVYEMEPSPHWVNQHNDNYPF